MLPDFLSYPLARKVRPVIFLHFTTPASFLLSLFSRDFLQFSKILEAKFLCFWKRKIKKLLKPNVFLHFVNINVTYLKRERFTTVFYP